MLTKIVLDTDIVIDYLRTGVGLLPGFLKAQGEREVALYCSTVLVLEIFSGQSSQKMEEKINGVLSIIEIMDLDSTLAVQAGKIKRDNKLEISSPDLVVAATALSLDAFLATKNRKHFAKIPKLKFFKTK